LLDRADATSGGSSLSEQMSWGIPNPATLRVAYASANAACSLRVSYVKLVVWSAGSGGSVASRKRHMRTGPGNSLAPHHVYTLLDGF